MVLHDVVTADQFADFYAANGLHTPEEKVDYLIKSMKIRAIRSEGEETPEEALEDLEEQALLGFWRGSW